jgi:hypothetical protein
MLFIRTARVALEDNFTPRFEHDPFIVGTSKSVLPIWLVVSDRGGGVREIALTIDGRVADTRADDRLGATCKPPYVDAVPCPLEHEATLHTDIATLADGKHVLQARATDAAGNTAVSAPVEFETRAGALVRDSMTTSSSVEPRLGPSPVAPPTIAPNVRLRAWFHGRSRPVRRTLRYGQSAIISGTLADDRGRPITGGQLVVDQRSAGGAPASSPRVIPGLDGRGGFSYRLPPGPSRVVEISYRAQDASAPLATAALAVRVKAGVTLRTSKRRVRNGSTMRFSGRVLGERGARRALVTIYALGGGPRKRIPVETVRARSDGRFSYAYRFTRIPGPSVYRFEARVPKQTGFPYLEGASRVVTVRGRP